MHCPVKQKDPLPWPVQIFLMQTWHHPCGKKSSNTIVTDAKFSTSYWNLTSSWNHKMNARNEIKSHRNKDKFNFFQVTSKYDTNRRASTLHWNNFHLSWKLPRTSLLLLWHALWLAQNTGAFFNQSDLKLEPTMTWSLAFSRAFDNSTLFSLSSH